jgi:predicted O-methyltransferase YrrM
MIKQVLYRQYRKLRRMGLKINESFSPAEREFRRVYPLIEPIEGLLRSPWQEKWLFKSARSLPYSANIVEIGSFKGRSTSSLAFGCRSNHCHVYAIDTFNGNQVDFFERGFLSAFKANIEHCRLTSFVTPIVGLSTELAGEWNKPINLLFIDGSHDYLDVLNDLENFFPFVVRGGMIAFHDVDPSWPGVVQVWQENALPKLTRVAQISNLAYGYKK